MLLRIYQSKVHGTLPGLATLSKDFVACSPITYRFISFKLCRRILGYGLVVLRDLRAVNTLRRAAETTGGRCQAGLGTHELLLRVFAADLVVQHLNHTFLKPIFFFVFLYLHLQLLYLLNRLSCHHVVLSDLFLTKFQNFYYLLILYLLAFVFFLCLFDSLVFFMNYVLQIIEFLAK